MIDADVQIAIKSVLDTRLPAVGLPGIDVIQSYSPTTAGAPLAPTVSFTKLFARRYGFQGAKYALNTPGPTATMDKVEPYYLWATYQLSGFMNQDPTDPASLTAYDVLDTCAAVLQSEEGRAIFKAAGIGVARITDIRAPHSFGDDNRFQTDVSFDFSLSYLNELASVVPGAASAAGNIERV
jgi:hypothetical protein